MAEAISKSQKYRPPKFYPTHPSPLQVDYYLVLDFEGVINKNDPGYVNVMEIIEFPVLKVNAKTLETESVFHTYVQPVIHPILNPICTEITGITQSMVEGRPKLAEVLEMLDAWLRDEGLLEDGVEFCFVTCGDWDLLSGLPINSHYLKIDCRPYLKRWINIKNYFEEVMKKKGHSMKTMLRDLNLELDGRHHSGIDDSKNIAKILKELAKKHQGLASGSIMCKRLK